MNLNDKQKTEYWTQRAEQRLINAENLSEDMLKSLRATYEEATKQIEKEINAFYGKYASETGLTLEDLNKRLNREELKDFKKELEKYYSEVKRLGGYNSNTKKYLRELSARAYISRLESLQTQIRYVLDKLGREEIIKYNETLSKGYEETYMRATFDVQQGIGFAYSFNTLDEQKVKIAISQNWKGDNFSNRIWDDKTKLLNTIGNRIPQGISLGQNPRKVARLINSDMESGSGGYKSALRLARTEMNHIANQATKDAYKEIPEILDQYKFVATLDNRTSSICQELDGTIHYVKDAQEGINYPNMHPNCRSTTIPYFPEMDSTEYTRIATDYSTGQAYYVPSSMSYKEWKASLNTDQEKAFIADKKIREQHSTDVKQLAEYRKLQTYANKNGKSELFEGMPRSLNEYQTLKYTEPEKYEILKENARIIRSVMK